MTKDRGRKRDVRAAQKVTGERYVRTARALAAPGGVPSQSFPPKLLLAESTTAPHAPYPHVEDYGSAPWAFFSEVLGQWVTEGSVLELAGALARVGLHADVRVEQKKADPVLVCEGRRYQMRCEWDGVAELCRHPGTQR